MGTRKHFILNETLLGDEIPLMMGRVVASVCDPLREDYRPKDPIEATDQHHNTQDILPNILPKPIKSGDRKDVLTKAVGGQLTARLEKVFGLEAATDSNSRMEITSKKVERFTLKQGEEIFKRLMKDEEYQSQVREFLKNKRKAYMVTGFLTTETTSWERGQASKKSASAKASISQETTSQPGVDASIEAKAKAEREQTNSEVTSQKMIFAVSYNVIALEYRFDFSAKNFATKEIKYGGEQRALNRQLALGHSEKMEIEEEEEEDEEKEREEAGRQEKHNVQQHEKDQNEAVRILHHKFEEVRESDLADQNISFANAIDL